MKTEGVSPESDGSEGLKTDLALNRIHEEIALNHRDYLNLGVLHPAIEALISTAIIIALLFYRNGDSMMPSSGFFVVFSLPFILVFHPSLYYVGVELLVREDKKHLGTIMAFLSVAYFSAISFLVLIIMSDSVGWSGGKVLMASLFLLPPMQYLITVLWISKQRKILVISVLSIILYYLLMFGIKEVLW